MIPKDTIDQIFETARIEEVVGDFVALKKRGVNYIGNCPFHNEKTPSFTVSPTKGIYKCFGCGKGGNSVKFIMEIEHYTYPEALKVIAKKYQIEIIEKELTNEQQEKQSIKESLYIVSKFANDYFQKSLWETEEGKTIGLSYFQERGFKKEIIKKFKLGYSPKIKDGLTKAAIKIAFDKDMSPDQIKTFSIKNRLPKNVIYKMLEKYHYLTFLKKCKKILDDGFNSYAFNRLIDIYLEKNEKEEAVELVEKFMPRFDYHSKSSNKSYVIRLNRMKIDSDSFETRKALSSFCNDIIENANIN
mgnify:CR=1 FL=1